MPTVKFRYVPTLLPASRQAGTASVFSRQWTGGQIFEQYRQLLADLPGITFMPKPPYGRCNRWLTVILIDGAEFGSTPDQVRLALEAENIESRPIWKPMHLQPVFSECGVRSAECGVETGRQAVARRSGKSVSEDLFARGLCLPSGTAMGEEDVERVGQLIRRCRGEGGRRTEGRREKLKH